MLTASWSSSGGESHSPVGHAKGEHPVKAHKVKS
jgi:hypothetical protein